MSEQIILLRIACSRSVLVEGLGGARIRTQVSGQERMFVIEVVESDERQVIRQQRCHFHLAPWWGDKVMLSWINGYVSTKGRFSIRISPSLQGVSTNHLFHASDLNRERVAKAMMVTIGQLIEKGGFDRWLANMTPAG